MEFINVEEKIRSSFPSLIESYVSQYGEEYREHITRTLDRCRFAIYVNPECLCNYIEQRFINDLFYTIIKTFDELNFDINGAHISYNSLSFSNDKTNKLLNVLFGECIDTKSIEDFNIYCFEDELDSDTLNYDIRRRIKVLEDIGLKDKDISYEEYFKSISYIKHCNFVKTILEKYMNNYERYCTFDLDQHLEYLDTLCKDLYEIGKMYERMFFLRIFTYLNDGDKNLILNVGNIEDLSCYEDFFERIDDNVSTFLSGDLLYFSRGYTEILLDDYSCFDEKEFIVKRRLDYLKRRNIYISYNNMSDLFCDWEKDDGLREYLPDMGLVTKFSDIRSSLYAELLVEQANRCIISDYTLSLADKYIASNMLLEGSQNCTCINGGDIAKEFYKSGKVRSDPISLIVFNPFTESYLSNDVSIDHELRHAIELSFVPKDGSLYHKIGCDYSRVNRRGFVDNRVGTLGDLNERITERLSVESTKNRWDEGIFILSDRIALISDIDDSNYDDDLDNLDIIFEPFRDDIVRSQIDNKLDGINTILTKRYAKEINRNIGDHSDRNKTRFRYIRDRLLMKRKKDKIKTKK